MAATSICFFISEVLKAATSVSCGTLCLILHFIPNSALLNITTNKFNKTNYFCVFFRSIYTHHVLCLIHNQHLNSFHVLQNHIPYMYEFQENKKILLNIFSFVFVLLKFICNRYMKVGRRASIELS